MTITDKQYFELNPLEDSLAREYEEGDLEPGALAVLMKDLPLGAGLMTKVKRDGSKSFFYGESKMINGLQHIIINHLN